MTTITTKTTSTILEGKLRKIFPTESEEIIQRYNLALGNSKEFLKSYGLDVDSLVTRSPKKEQEHVVEEGGIIEKQFKSSAASEMSSLAYNPQHYNSIIAEETLDIKLIITIINGDMITTIATMASHLFNYVTKYGYVHTALSVGPKIIEWVDCSLCIPRLVGSSSAIIAIDIAKISGKEKIGIVLSKMADIVTQWNNYIEYSVTQYNCQAFVDELLKAMEITPQFSFSMQNFMDNIRKKGLCATKYTVSKDIAEKLQIQKGTIKFKTHKELDEFIILFQDKLKNDTYLTTSEGKSDQILLKAFDRAFWLKYNKDKGNSESNEDYQKRITLARCLEDDTGQCLCPFSDPETTVTQWKSTRTIKKESEKNNKQDQKIYEEEQEPHHKTDTGTQSNETHGISGMPPKLDESFQISGKKCILS